MELLKTLYAISSPSGQEKKMKKFIKSYIRKNISEAKYKTDPHGNILIVKGESETYPCVAAHLDEVCPNKGKQFEVLEGHGKLMGFNWASMERTGLGGDDKNGLWICLRALERFDNIKCAFFVGEEAGCIGSHQVDLDFFADCRFILEPDRKGKSDLITTCGGWCGGGTKMCSDDFRKAIDEIVKAHNYTDDVGTLTDVRTLVERGVGISTLNLSCGYYNAHSDDDYTVIADLENARDFVFDIIENITDVYPHLDIVAPRQSIYDDYIGLWGHGYTKKGNKITPITPRCSSAFDDKMNLPSESETTIKPYRDEYAEMREDLETLASEGYLYSLEDYYNETQGMWESLDWNDYLLAYNEITGSPYQENWCEDEDFYQEYLDITKS